MTLINIVDIYKVKLSFLTINYVFIDFKIAFNTVNRAKLYEIIQSKDILKGNELSFLKGYTAGYTSMALRTITILLMESSLYGKAIYYLIFCIYPP